MNTIELVIFILIAFLIISAGVIGFFRDIEKEKQAEKKYTMELWMKALRDQTNYLDMDCKNCGRHRVEKNYICEKCGYDNKNMKFVSHSTDDEK